MRESSKIEEKRGSKIKEWENERERKQNEILVNIKRNRVNKEWRQGKLVSRNECVRKKIYRERESERE